MEMKTLTVNGKTYIVADPDAAHFDNSKAGNGAWSGKHTVDRLCPAFSESGSVVRCDPVEGYPLSVVSQIQPVQEGEGDPSPGNWVEIPDAVDSQNITSAITAIELTPGITYRLKYNLYDFDGNEVSVTGAEASMYETNESVSGTLQNGFFVFSVPTSGRVMVTFAEDGSADQSEYRLCEYDPGNVRPITGFGSAELWRGGKNLLPEGWKDWSNYADGKFQFWLPPGRYCVSGSFDTTKERYVYLERSTDGGQSWTVYGIGVNGTSGHILAGTQVRTVVFDVTGDPKEKWGIWTMKQYVPYIQTLQIECGTVATSYEPYRGETFAVELGQTVGKGTYDWNRGVLTVTHALIRLTSDMKWTMTGATNPNGIRSFYVNENTENAADSSTKPVMSSHYIYVYNWSVSSVAYENAIKILNSRIYLSDARFTDLASFKAFLEEETVQLMYPLAEPVTVQLTPQEILALSGTNTIYSDTGDTQVSGKANPGAVIEKLTNAIIALGGKV